ncbi:MAG TPA: hypothetical protein PLJ21_12790 [Pseudobdellovibrionaceae bacterium]|nr:hypothetical protein [Pseudobdellovibrionaceae bacterium]
MNWIVIISFLLIGACQQVPTRIQSDQSSLFTGREDWVVLDLREPFEREMRPIPWASAFDASDFCPPLKKELIESDFIKMSQRLALKGVALNSNLTLIHSDPKAIEKVLLWFKYLGLKNIKLISADEVQSITRKEFNVPKPSVPYWTPLFVKEFKPPQSACN